MQRRVHLCEIHKLRDEGVSLAEAVDSCLPLGTTDPGASGRGASTPFTLTHKLQPERRDKTILEGLDRARPRSQDTSYAGRRF